MPEDVETIPRTATIALRKIRARPSPIILSAWWDRRCFFSADT